MDDRYNGIEKAYQSVIGTRKSTYDWVFDRPGPGFVDWLETGHGIFWVNGKAGSGKSTLMKFIRDDSRLKHHLRGVSGNWKEVIIADFYFWAAGSTEQCSQIGLLMTMLYRILSQAKALLPIVTLREWEYVGPIAARIVHNLEMAAKSRDQSKSTLQHAIVEVNRETKLQWTRQSLLQVFHDLLMNLPPSTLLFFLIDGLDEYKAKEQEMEELAELLMQTGRTGNVKICISTRPWTIFENLFGNGQCPTFQLQYLTYNDIRNFVTESFERLKLMQNIREAYPKQIPDFYSTIIRKAEGVFLWVRLVVRSMIRGLQNGDELSNLQKKVDELPKDLEHLYMHLLDGIKPEYWERSSKIFRIVQATLVPPRALTIWYSGETEANPLENLALDTRLARCYQVHLRLMSQCAGLLELRQSVKVSEDIVEADILRPYESWSLSDRHHYLQSAVYHLHRTTKDFLDQPEIASILRSRNDGKPAFDPNKWLALYTLAELMRSVTTTTGFPRYYQEQDLWDTNGFYISELSRNISFYAEKCEDRILASCLSKTRDSILGDVGLKVSLEGRFVESIQITNALNSVTKSGTYSERTRFSGRKQLEHLLSQEGVKF